MHMHVRHTGIRFTDKKLVFSVVTEYACTNLTPSTT